MREKLSMSFDGVFLPMPPWKEVARFNFCWGGVTYVWRKRSEANIPALACADDYDKQVPVELAFPLWGGISEDGFQAVHWHEGEKTNNIDWAPAVRSGHLTGAIRKLNPRRRSGPWTVLCDNESFLRHPNLKKAYATRNIHLWDVPAESPDLSPIEMFWGWARRQLRLQDLADLRSKRRPFTKAEYIVRIKTLFRTQKAQRAAKSFAAQLRKTCKEVIANKGAAART